jgi:hypothetical protein
MERAREVGRFFRSVGTKRGDDMSTRSMLVWTELVKRCAIVRQEGRIDEKGEEGR